MELISQLCFVEKGGAHGACLGPEVGGSSVGAALQAGANDWDEMWVPSNDVIQRVKALEESWRNAP